MNRRLPSWLSLLVVPLLLTGCGTANSSADDDRPAPPAAGTTTPDWDPSGLPPFVEEDPTAFVGPGEDATFPEGSIGRLEGRTLTLRHDDGSVSGEVPRGPYGYGFLPVILDLGGSDGYLVQSSDGEYAAYSVLVSTAGALLPGEATDVPLGRGFGEDDKSYYSFVIHPDGAQKGTLVTRTQQGGPTSRRYTFWVWSAATGSTTLEPTPYRDVCVDYAVVPVEWGRC